MSTVPVPHVAVPDIDFPRVLQGVKHSKRITTEQIAKSNWHQHGRLDALMRGAPAFYRKGMRCSSRFSVWAGKFDYVESVNPQ